MVTQSAPGKLMIVGEHAVVFGRPCIVTAVDQRLGATADKIAERRTIIEAPQVKDTRFVDATIEEFFTTVGSSYAGHGVKLTIHSQFSRLFGFGSSSAVTVATFAALASEFNIRLTKKECFDHCFHIVTKVQGVGSGFDIAAAIWGGTLFFRKAGHTIDPIQLAVPLVVGYSGVKADTASLVRMVQEKYATDQSAINGYFDRIESLVHASRKAIDAANWQALGSYCSENQQILQELGVSTDKLDAMTAAAIKAGAYGAKLSGAGGGDCMIAVVSEKTRTAVSKAIEQAGGVIMDVHTHADGVYQGDHAVSL